jgi:hypothetical protein
MVPARAKGPDSDATGVLRCSDWKVRESLVEEFLADDVELEVTVKHDGGVV